MKRGRRSRKNYREDFIGSSGFAGLSGTFLFETSTISREVKSRVNVVSVSPLLRTTWGSGNFWNCH